MTATATFKVELLRALLCFECYVNKTTMFIFGNSLGPIDTWILFQQSYYIATFKNVQNDCLGSVNCSNQFLQLTRGCSHFMNKLEQLHSLSSKYAAICLLFSCHFPNSGRCLINILWCSYCCHWSDFGRGLVELSKTKTLIV